MNMLSSNPVDKYMFKANNVSRNRHVPVQCINKDIRTTHVFITDSEQVFPPVGCSAGRSYRILIKR